MVKLVMSCELLNVSIRIPLGERVMVDRGCRLHLILFQFASRSESG